MSEPNWERLQELLDITRDAHKRKHFCYPYYFHTKGVGTGQSSPGHIPNDRQEENWCDTAACFAGHAVSYWENPLWSNKGLRIDSLHDISDTAADLLGLDDAEQQWLFCAIPDGSLNTRDELNITFDLKLRKYMKRSGQTLEDVGLEYLEYVIGRSKFKRPDKFIKMRLKSLKAAQ
jgi:hypothetical protein